MTTLTCIAGIVLNTPKSDLEPQRFVINECVCCTSFFFMNEPVKVSLLCLVEVMSDPKAVATVLIANADYAPMHHGESYYGCLLKCFCIISLHSSFTCWLIPTTRECLIAINLTLSYSSLYNMTSV